MYYDSIMRRIKKLEATAKRREEQRVDVMECIAPAYYDLHQQVVAGSFTTFHLPGGRGSCKSSFASLEIVDGLDRDENANAIVFRKTAETLRDSAYTQVAWAVDMLGLSDEWRGSVSPMAFTNARTGQQILFRGLDDASKIKSIRPKHGYFKFIWCEEFSELDGPRMVRSVLQSTMRGGDSYIVFNTFNPPLSRSSWANKYILEPDETATVFKTDYTMIPPEWLGEPFLAEAERLRQVNEPAYLHEYMGEPIGDGGQVFPNVETRAITDAEVQGMGYRFCGVDFGFSQDPVAVVLCSYDRKTETIFILDEIVRLHCTNAELAELIRQKGFDVLPGEPYYSPLFGTSSSRKQPIYCDSAEPKSIHDLVGMGLKCLPCTKYAGSVLYGIRWLQGRRIVIDPARTPVAAREFIEYEYERDRDGNLLASVPDKDNHVLDATRYAFDHLINSKNYSA